MTPEQKVTLRANMELLSNVGGVLEGKAQSGDWAAFTAYYNTLANPVVKGWRTDAQVSDIMDAITWTSYTPTDAATDSTTTFANRAWVINIKQMNLQNMLFGRTAIDCSKSGIRSGLRDAVIQLPAGTGGASVNAAGASGATLLNACTRQANRVESLLSLPSQTTGTVSAVIFDFQGSVDDQLISDVWGNL